MAAKHQADYALNTMEVFNPRRSIFVYLILPPLLLCMNTAARSDNRPNARQAIVLTIDGPIGPASSDYFERGLAHAAQQGAALVILRMDTPGGLDTAMRAIIKTILSSPVPVVSYVSPSGARAASAGTYILYASHVAAMAPGTNVGAATPVQLGAPEAPRPPTSEPPKGGKSEPPASSGDAMEHKLVNDAVAYLRGLAQLRGRNAEWAEKAVREAASLPATDALRLGVVDVIAKDIPDLLRQLDGRHVEVAGRSITLNTANLVTVNLQPDWRSRLLAVITNPNVAYVLMLIGIYGLIFEFSNPGSVIPGTVGAICLLLALFAFQALPVSYAGMALVLLGIALMVAEAFVPSFGALGIGGVIAFAIGSVILIDTEAPGFGISPALIAAFTVFSALLLMLVLNLVLKARHRPVVSGGEELVGSRGLALTDVEPDGKVRVHSEIWSAHSASPVHAGEPVHVIGRSGLVLEIEPSPPQSKETH